MARLQLGKVLGADSIGRPKAFRCKMRKNWLRKGCRR
jgi:hypothetical protein